MINNKIGKLDPKHTKMQRWYRYLILLPLLVAASDSFAQQNDTLRRRDGDGRYFIQVRSHGLITDEGYLQNNQPDGIWTNYWHTQFPKQLTSYRLGKKNGSVINLAPMGKIEKIDNYRNDKLEGPSRLYNEEGMLIEEALYSDGLKHGPYTKWYPNGKKQEESSFVGDKRDGKAVWYFKDGTKAAEYSYRDDAIDGDAATYFNNGKVSANGPYVKGKQIGIWKEYHENGNLKAEGKYVNGEKEGAWQEFDVDGKNPKTVNYKKGERK